MWRSAVAAIAALVLAPVPALAACTSALCKDASAAVQDFIAAQAVSYAPEEYQGWMRFTALTQAPTFPVITIVKTTVVDEVTCKSDSCSARVVYDSIGTAVPFEVFTPKRERIVVTYSLARNAGRMLITSPLPAKFVSVASAVDRPRNVVSGSPVFLRIYEALSRSVEAAANAPNS